MSDFSLSTYAALVDTLNLANIIEGKELYSWETITPKDRTVRESNGLAVMLDSFYQDTDSLKLSKLK